MNTLMNMKNSPGREGNGERRMKTLQILGTGCPNCRKLMEATEVAATRLGMPYRIEKVTGIREILAFGVMSTPALAVDGTVKFSGRIPATEEIERILSSA